MKLSSKEDSLTRKRADEMYNSLLLARVLGKCTKDQLVFMEQMDGLYRDERESRNKNARSGRRS